ncbi:hypothetical protein ACHAWO_009411 [Cyclotella atomus]|uniref:E2F-associated phosphoprotein n=1 Tax=Cyclotella atomus TaxID=382360 RepID=A0ABD3PC56_9STRA
MVSRGNKEVIFFQGIPLQHYQLIGRMDDSAIVSETDAAHSSEDEDQGWLSNSAATTQRSRLSRVDEQAGAGAGAGASDENQQLEDSDDEIDEDPPADELYCANMDDEDEAWVYKHLRSGKEESVYVRMHQTKDDGGSQKGDTMEEDNAPSAGSEANATKSDTTPQNPISATEQMQKALLLKPRNSDAVLSCPRCFTTVCMDCQQHEKYANQYRAMFVMNIGVDWNKRMIFDDALGGLKVVPPLATNEANRPDTVPHDSEHGSENEKRELYYSVHCGYCQYEVAALDMSDEIYYFYGCIASG